MTEQENTQQIDVEEILAAFDEIQQLIPSDLELSREHQQEIFTQLYKLKQYQKKLKEETLQEIITQTELALFHMNRKLISRQLKKRGITEENRNYDLYLNKLEKTLGDSIRNYNPENEKHASFGTYAIRCMELAVIRVKPKSFADLQEYLPDIGVDPIEPEIEQKELAEKLKQAIEETLTPIEQEILSRRYGLNGYVVENTEQIGERLSLSRSRIGQICEIAFKKIRDKYGKTLEPYLDEDQKHLKQTTHSK